MFASAAACRACDFVSVLAAGDRECENKMLRDILSGFVSVTRCAIVRCLTFTFVLWQSADNRVAETWTFVAVDATRRSEVYLGTESCSGVCYLLYDHRWAMPRCAVVVAHHCWYRRRSQMYVRT